MHFQTFRFWIHATVLGPDTEHQIPQYISELLKSATGPKFGPPKPVPGLTQKKNSVQNNGHRIVNEF